MPKHAYLYAVPYELYEKYGVRRYGFHGTSHQMCIRDRMKASGSINVFTGILVFILIWLVVSQVLEMKLLGSIFDKLVSVGAVSYTHLWVV